MTTIPQGCFDQRMRAWQRWQEAQSTLQKKREAEAKLLWANKPDKLQQAKEEIAEVTMSTQLLWDWTKPQRFQTVDLVLFCVIIYDCIIFTKTISYFF